MKVVAAYNIKGGVGKTATAVNLAYLAARDGARTLLWDLDPQGAASFYFRIEPKIPGGTKKILEGKKDLDELVRGTDFENLDLLPADFSYRKLDLALAETKRPSHQLGRLIGPLVDTYDYLFLDCPPSLSVLSESLFSLADALVVPTVPTPLSLRALEQLHHHLEEKGPKDLKVLPFLSLVDRRKLMHREPQWLLKQAPFPMLKTQIPYSSLVESMGLRQQPVTAFAPSSWAGQAFASLWKEVKRKLAS
jgi:cellulose biosynthesis protein BcsQ